MPAKKTAAPRTTPRRPKSMKVPAAIAGAARRRSARKASEKAAETRASRRINWAKAVRHPSREEVKKVLDSGVSRADQLLESAMKWVVRLAMRAKAVYDMLSAWWHGKFDLPVGTLQAALVGLLYFLSPLDILPDVLPLFGLADDAAVFAFVVHKIKADLETFAAISGKTVADLGL